MNVNEARSQWELAAPGWAKWEDVISAGATVATEKMLIMAGILDGSHVLDLASGAGSQTLMAAKKAGLQGHVVANDISPTMLEHVEKNAQSKRISNVSTLLGAVQELAIAPNSFDAAICRFALMLFSDPAIVLSNVYKILKPKGKISTIVFSAPTANEFFVKPMQILLRHAGKEPLAGGPGLFSLSVPAILEKLFVDSGYVNVEIVKQDLTFKMPPSSEALLMIQEAFGAYRAVISDCSQEVQKSAWEEVLDYLKSLETPQGIEISAQVLISSAQKPS